MISYWNIKSMVLWPPFSLRCNLVLAMAAFILASSTIVVGNSNSAHRQTPFCGWPLLRFIQIVSLLQAIFSNHFHPCRNEINHLWCGFHCTKKEKRRSLVKQIIRFLVRKLFYQLINYCENNFIATLSKPFYDTNYNTNYNYNTTYYNNS